MYDLSQQLILTDGVASDWDKSSSMLCTLNVMNITMRCMACRVQHVRQRVLLSSSKTQGRAQQPPCVEEVQTGRAQVDFSKSTAMLSALASGGSLNLNQELVVRDCCFKWKQG